VDFRKVEAPSNKGGGLAVLGRGSPEEDSPSISGVLVPSENRPKLPGVPESQNPDLPHPGADLDNNPNAGSSRSGSALLERPGLWEALVALVAVALFGRTVGFGWVYDDQMEIVLNSFVHSIRNLPLIFSNTVWAGSGMETYLYRPLTLVSYAANHLVSGLSPWSYHLGNVLLYAGISGMVVRVGRRWGLSTLAAGSAGLIFAVHPVHVEVVAAVFGRKDLLVAFFTLAMVLLHPLAVARGGWRALLPILAYACAMLSKEVGVVGLALVAGQDWLLSRDRSQLARDGRRARIFVGYVATLLAYVLIRNAVTGGVGVPETFYMDNPLLAVSLWVRLSTAVAVIGKGLALQAVPLSLSPDYSFNAIPLVRSVFDLRFLGTLALLAGAGWGLWRSRNSTPALDAEGGPAPVAFRMASVWYAVTVIPTANLLVTVGTIFGERLLFLPSVAVCLLAGIGLDRLIQGLRGPVRATPGSERARKWVGGMVAAGAGLWVGFLLLQTLSYTDAWSDDIALFRQAVASVPNSTKANHKLGEELLRAGELGPSLPFLRRALEIAPDNAFAARTLEGARQQVVRLYLPSSTQDPVSARPPNDPEILYFLGVANREGGNLTEARRFWEAAVTADPTHVPSLGDLGALRLAQGDTTAALGHLRDAVRLDPSRAGAWFLLGRVHLANGDVDSAREALEAFIESAGSRSSAQVVWAQEALARLPLR
jgi:Flp pilus assembly protein TadD